MSAAINPSPGGLDRGPPTACLWKFSEGREADFLRVRPPKFRLRGRKFSGDHDHGGRGRDQDCGHDPSHGHRRGRCGSSAHRQNRNRNHARVTITIVIAPIVVDRAVIQSGLYEPSLVLAVSKRGAVPAIINNPPAKAIRYSVGAFGPSGNLVNSFHPPQVVRASLSLVILRN
jgi:hypothetical protein